MRLGTKSQVLILVAVVLSVYYSAIFATVNSVDDSHIIATYGMGAGKGLNEIFRPAGHYYFRPLVELSYYLDNLLWGMHAQSMHLENILLHVLNSVLLFFVARQIAEAWSVKIPLFPLASALLFALHPVNTEAITWIAGRTDPMACSFVISAIWCLQQCLLTDRLLYLWPSLLLLFLGVLTKETGICFLPVAALMTIVWPCNPRLRPIVLRVLTFIFLCVVVLVLVFCIFDRSLSVTALINSKPGGLIPAVQAILTALGFYMKKLVLPLPLNFAIDTISQYYLLPGVVIVLILPFWMKKRSISSVLTAVCIVFLLPALLLSILQVAWTPYAERYLYIPSAFFCMVLVIGLFSLLEKLHRQQWMLTVVLCIASCGAFLTAQRNFVWHDNISLYRDTVSKSDDFGAVHLELGLAFLQKGRIKEGRAEIEKADKLNKRPSLKNRIKANLMAVRLYDGDIQGAREYFYSIFKHKDEADLDFLHILNKADDGLANKTKDIAARDKIYRDMMNTHDVIYRKTHDPFNLYQNGILASRCRDNAMALAYMRKAVQEAPEGTHYTRAAKKWLHNLEVLE